MDRVLHPLAPVRAYLLSLLCLSALGVVWPGEALAGPGAGTTTTPTNMGNLTVATLSIGGVPNTASASAKLYVNAKHCADPSATVEARVRGLGSITKSNLSVWVGNNCNQNRAMTGSNSSDCVHIYDTPLNRQPEVIVPIPVGMLQGCEGNLTVTAWFMPMNMPGSETETITDYGTQVYNVDTVPPATPTNVSGGSGESQIKVDWDSVGGDIQNFYVYWDTAIGGGGDEDAGAGECATSNVHAGAKLDPDEPAPQGVGKQKTASNATTVDLDGADIDGDMAGVAVQAVDLAGNASPLSETACVEVVETTGFWDLYEANGGEVEEGCACSLPGRGARSSRAPWLLGSTLLALVALRRRRRA